MKATGPRSQFRLGRSSYLLLVLIAISACGWSEPTRVDVFLECPSPDRVVVAILWAEAGGGAAGWSRQLLSIQPSGVPIDQTPGRKIGNEAPVLSISSGEHFQLTWETNERLSVTVGYSDRAQVYSMNHSQDIDGRRIRLVYHELEASSDPISAPPTKCQSGSMLIENPTPKRLK
jgi:hypothetical protein